MYVACVIFFWVLAALIGGLLCVILNLSADLSTMVGMVAGLAGVVIGFWVAEEWA